MSAQAATIYEQRLGQYKKYDLRIADDRRDFFK